MKDFFEFFVIIIVMVCGVSVATIFVSAARYAWTLSGGVTP
jgi:hypothetical protein